MNKLLELGIEEQDIKNMIQVNPQILDMSDEEVRQLLDILYLNQCDEQIIYSVIIANPMYLSRDLEDVNKLLKKLKSLGITRLDITIDSNPWILNYDDFEIDDFIVMKENEGLNMDDIIGLLEQGVVE